MAGKTTYLTIKEFKNQAVLNQFDSECTVNNLSFKKEETLEHHRIKEVLDICNKYNNFNINTLIVNSQETLTIWIEEKSQASSAQDIEIQEDKGNQDKIESRQTNQSIPTKKVIKRYRGQVYEEVVVDWGAMQQLNQQNKSPRKYRGQYID